MIFEEWKSKQDFKEWGKKYFSKKQRAKNDNREFLLSFNDYLFKAFEANLKDHLDINIRGYHLSRIGDKGGYTIENCRFLLATDNYKERDTESFKLAQSNRLIGNNLRQGKSHKYIPSLEACTKISESNRGIGNNKAKLSESQVISIFHSKLTNSELALEYNMNSLSIFNIKSKKTWSHITKDLICTQL